MPGVVKRTKVGNTAADLRNRAHPQFHHIPSCRHQLISTMAPSAQRMLTGWIFVAVLVSTAQASRLLTAFHSASTAERGQVIRAELMHRDHPDSPLAPAEGATLTERWAAAVKRSESLRAATRGRRLADFQTPVTRFGDFSGDYIMSIAFGTPPQRFVGLVDTGSDLVWVQCLKCAGCTNFPQPDPLYDPAASSSETFLPCSDPRCDDFVSNPCSGTSTTCRIKYGYADGSRIQGTLTTESITLMNTAGANPATSEFVMGCMNNNSETGFDNYDGIVGFGRGKYSLPSQLSTVSYLRVFSYCLVPFPATTTTTSYMLFGASNTANALVYTPLLPIGTTYYNVNMTGISVGGVLLDIPASVFEYSAASDTGGVIFDSGNSITRFFPEVYTTVRDAVASLITYPVVPVPDNADRYCFDISGVTAPVYPKLTLHFGAEDGLSVVDFELGDENSFGPYTDTAGVSCLAFRPSAADDMSIGNLQQANHYIETDVENMRMGWVTKDCTI